MVDTVLLVGKLLLLGLLYLFLFAAIRAGMGLVRVAGPGVESGDLTVRVVEGPRELKGVRVPVAGPVVIGRSPAVDIVISDDFISSQHARIVPAPGGAILEDLGSTNGTILNGHAITAPATLGPGDEIELGTVRLKVERS
jgi:pSer/pThr/pTyr-binding forkhead associated (FHA) protein